MRADGASGATGYAKGSIDPKVAGFVLEERASEKGKG